MLVADDDDATRAAIAARLRALGYRVTEFADGGRLADRLLDAHPTAPMPDVVVAAMFLPGKNSLEICSSAHDTGLPVRFILTTSVPSDELRDEANRAGADAVLEAPVEIDRLADAVAELLSERE